MILLAKAPFPEGDGEWWVYLLDSSRLAGSTSRTLVYFTPTTGERRLLSLQSDALTFEDLPESLIRDGFASATPF